MALMLPLFCCAFGGSCNRYALIPATQPKGFSPAAIPVSRDPSFLFLPPPLARRQAPRFPPGLPCLPVFFASVLSAAFQSQLPLPLRSSLSPPFVFCLLPFLFQTSISVTCFFLPPPFPSGYPVTVRLVRIDSTCPVESKSNRCRRGSGGGIERSEKA